MAKRIYLIGFMGSGKTTVGRLLAERLNWSFLDLDLEIERAEKRSVRDIFQNSGEPYFRNLESKRLQEISTSAEQVVALGGGAYIEGATREFVESHGVSVYLETALESIQTRIANDGSRPLFSDRERVRELYLKRLPSYRMAQVTINTEGLKAEEVVDRIVDIVRPL